jgi:hypothetical protein
MMTRCFTLYFEYRRVGLGRGAAMRLAWLVAATGAVPLSSRHHPQSPV